MWLPWKPHGDDEAGLKLGDSSPGRRAAPKRLVPWWVGAMRRAKAASVIRRQSKTSRDGGGRRKRRAAPRPLWTPQRGQGVVPAQSAQRRLGQARALSGARARPARRERGPRFRSRTSRASIWPKVVRELGARRPACVVVDYLAGGRRAHRSAAARARLRGRDGAGPRYRSRVGRDRSSQHR